MSRFSGVFSLSEERVSELLCSAREGGSYGSGYWAEFIDCPYHFDQFEPGKPISPLRLNLPARIRDFEADKPKIYTLNLKAIKRGLSLLPTIPHVFCNILKEESDGGDADVFLQLCLFGEVLYG